MLIMVGLAGPKVRAKAVADGKTVNIQLPQYNPMFFGCIILLN